MAKDESVRGKPEPNPVTKDDPPRPPAPPALAVGGTAKLPGGPDASAKSRKASNVIGRWVLDKGQLVVNEPATEECQIEFGIAAWTDFDFTCEAKKLSGRGEITLMFRSRGSDNYLFTVGKYTGDVESLGASTKDKTVMTRLRERRTRALETNRWYPMEVRVRGNEIACRFNDELVFRELDQRHTSGGVGLRTWRTGAAFRNIRVTDPAGGILFEGLPELPAGGR